MAGVLRKSELPVTLRKIHRFTEDQQLEAKLQRLQDAVEAELDALERKTPRFPPTDIKTSNYTAKLGELVVCDATATAVTVTLPETTDSNHGEQVAVMKMGTGNDVVLVGNSCDVARAASYTLPDNHYIYIFVSTRDGWLRVL